MTFSMAEPLRRKISTVTPSAAQKAERLDEALVSIGRTTSHCAKAELRFEITRLRRRLAQMFGERHGWRYTRAEFAPAVLARRGMANSDRSCPSAWPYPLIDHPDFFRTADRRAVALAAHLFVTSPGKRNDAAAWAAQHHLRVEFPADFPSWWVPGGTTLCIYLPEKEGP